MGVWIQFNSYTNSRGQADEENKEPMDVPKLLADREFRRIKTVFSHPSRLDFSCPAERGMAVRMTLLAESRR